MSPLAIVWLIVFVIWALSGGLYVYTDAGVRYRAGHSWLLVFLVGVLGYVLLYKGHLGG